MKLFRPFLIPILILAFALASAQSRDSRSTKAKIVIGKLGQALKATTIYSRPTSRSRAYYRSKAYEYLVVRPTKSPAWLGVVLQTGAIGFIKAATVTTLPYVVKADAPPAQRVFALSSRGAGSDLARYSLNFVGTPYKWGGNDVMNGIDCSGFVKKMYGQIGINLPRTAAEQALVGMPITQVRDLQPGDRLYFWEAKRHKIGHTGMYLGKGYFVHSSSGHGGVATDYLLTPRWMHILIAARR